MPEPWLTNSTFNFTLARSPMERANVIHKCFGFTPSLPLAYFYLFCFFFPPLYSGVTQHQGKLPLLAPRRKDPFFTWVSQGVDPSAN